MPRIYVRLPVVDKTQVYELMVAKIQADRDFVRGAAVAARDAATHDESRAEDSHDTRAIEASYLAGAAAERALDLDKLVTYIRALGAEARDRAVEGALVTLAGEDGGGEARTTYCWLAARSGGPTVKLGAATIQWVTPQSPLGEAVWGKAVGDSFEVEMQATTREYEVTRID